MSMHFDKAVSIVLKLARKSMLKKSDCYQTNPQNFLVTDKKLKKQRAEQVEAFEIIKYTLENQELDNDGQILCYTDCYMEGYDEDDL